MVACIIIVLDVFAVLMYIRTHLTCIKKRLSKRRVKTSTRRVYVEKTISRRDNIKFFDDCVNEKELHLKYRRLCKQHHPDAGGDLEEFYKIQNEYEKICHKFRAV